jgi:hypothetical protein
MHRVLEAGTDTAGLCLFDPTALPPEVDRRGGPEAKVLDALATAGRLHHWNLEGDGDASLGLWVDEPLPSDLLPHAQRLAHAEALHLPSGRLYFAGAEYVFHQDDALLKKHPRMGQSADVPAGVYGFELYELTPPESAPRSIEDSLSPAERWLSTLVELLLSVGGLALLLFPIALLVNGLQWARPWSRWVLLLLGGLLLLDFLATRLPAYRRVLQKRQSSTREWPDYALVLRRGP